MHLLRIGTEEESCLDTGQIKTMFRITGRLQEEREAAESLRQKKQAHYLHLNLGSRLNELKERLAQAQKRLREQQEASEDLIRQMTMERDESRSQLSASEAKAHRLEGQLEMAHERLLSQGAASPQLIRKLEAERDQSRTQLSEAEAGAQKLQEIRKQEKKAAEVLAHQLKAEQDERRTQLSGFESHLQNLEELLVLAQRQFQDQREAVIRVIQRRTVGGEENQ